MNRLLLVPMLSVPIVWILFPVIFLVLCPLGLILRFRKAGLVPQCVLLLVVTLSSLFLFANIKGFEGVRPVPVPIDQSVGVVNVPKEQENPSAAFFHKHVEPILATRCLGCHGSDRTGGLDLRTSITALAGGDSGAVIEPGMPNDSLLMQYVSAGEMPPDEPLTQAEIATLETWIEQGAWFPDWQLDPYAFSSEDGAGYDWWSLQPVKRLDPPRVKHAKPLLNDIDRFVIAGLEANDFTLNPPADRVTYIRRVTYNLTGLLPTPEEVQAFVSDRGSDAYERLVDRLLDSPQYGERWGRHWLDVVRFAESNGFERDVIRRNFWPYRDYVIRAFNDDKPFDQFVIEQLAGDALDLNKAEYHVALGFLAAGPKNDQTTVSELEKMRTRQDELDEFVVATATTFLGLTVGCARCHDHKFDPIPTNDYYAMTAVFSGCDHTRDGLFASPEEQRRYDEQVNPFRKRIEEAKQHQREILESGRQFPNVARAEKPNDGTSKLESVSARANADTFPPVLAKFVKFTSLKTNNGQSPCLDELEVFGLDETRNLALSLEGAIATASSVLPDFESHQIHHLNDGRYGNSYSWISNEFESWAKIELAEVAEINRVVWGRDRDGQFTDRVPVDYRIEISLDGEYWEAVVGPIAGVPLSPSLRQTYNDLEAEIAHLNEQIKAVPPLPTTYSIRDTGGTNVVPVLRRGDVRSPDGSIAAGALSEVLGLKRDLTADSGPERRLKLARWIANPANPLTARVFVNRVWHYHFGQGLVDTPSDFGFKGGRPSHPELLDWLAADFVQNGWKIKRLHRLIVLSATYRQSSKSNDMAAAEDAGNRLLWRYAPQRLEAEAIRDRILQVSGKLDLEMGGPSFELFHYRDSNVPDYELIELPGPETWRRSVYRYNIRTFSSPLLSAFDCPDPSLSTPTRSQSTNPLQALSLLNNPFVVEQSKFLAERIQSSTGNDLPTQIHEAYRLVLLREPSDAERERAMDFAARYGLAGLCRILINSNEFLYVY